MVLQGRVDYYHRVLEGRGRFGTAGTGPAGGPPRCPRPTRVWGGVRARWKTFYEHLPLVGGPSQTLWVPRGLHFRRQKSPIFLPFRPWPHTVVAHKGSAAWAPEAMGGYPWTMPCSQGAHNCTPAAPRAGENWIFAEFLKWRCVGKNRLGPLGTVATFLFTRK